MYTSKWFPGVFLVSLGITLKVVQKGSSEWEILGYTAEARHVGIDGAYEKTSEN